MIQVTRADDLEQQAARLDAEATELEQLDPSQADRRRREATRMRQQATQLRRGRTDGVRFG
jgi:hypothetical protein